MKMFARIGLLVSFLAVSGLLYADTTVGTFTSGNCYPFMCNDSGTSTGQSIDYQQVFAPSAFSGVTTINSITWTLDTPDGGTPNLLGGSYSFYLGYSANPVGGLSTTLSDNVASEVSLGAAPVPVGGVAIDGSGTFSLSGITPFVYNPADGALLLEVVVTDQDNVANHSGNGYNQADTNGLVTSRAYCITGQSCVADNTGLVTTFGGTSTTPEPVTAVLLGSGLLGLAGLRRKRIA